MKLHEIRIKNFGCFLGDHVLRIPKPGLYFITGINRVEPELGANGCGKSTLIDALYWTLTGRTIADRRPGNSIEPRQLSKGTVSVEIDFDDHTLSRTRRPNSLQLDSTEISQQDLLDWLGISDDNLRRTLIVGQKGDLFLDLGAEEQSRMFTDMLDAEIWIELADRAGKKSSAMERSAAESDRLVAEGEGRLDSLKEQLDDEIASDRSFAKAKRAKIESAETNLVLTRRALAAHQKAKPKRNNTEEAIRDLGGKIKSASSELQKLRDEKAGLELELSTIDGEMSRITVQLSQYTKSAKTCPECGQKVSQAHIQKKYDNLERDLVNLSMRSEPVMADLARVCSQIPRAEKKLSNQEREIEELREAAAASVEALGKWDKALIRLQHEEDFDDRRLTQLVEVSNPHEKQIGVIRARLEVVEKNLRRDRSQAERERRLADQYKYWQTAYKEIRLNLIDETLVEVEVAANRHAEQHGLLGWRIEMATERTTQVDKVSRGFVATVFPPDDEPIKWERNSGGEAQRWQLAVTFALSEILLSRAGIKTNIEMIDEPTKHLSTEGIDDLLSSLRERAIDLGRAIYLVDHCALDRGAFDGVITIEREEEGSRILLG